MHQSTRTNDLYAWTGHGSGATATPSDGLNRIATVAGAGVGYDARGNLTYDPSTGRGYAYWSENELTSTSGGQGYSYDALSRMVDTAAWQFAYDGGEVVGVTANYGPGLIERYVRGDGADELIAWYEGAGAGTRRWAHADERGSIVAVSDVAGAVTAIDRYDEYGKPQVGNIGRFQYTGQMWLSEIGIYHYKNRVYAPQFGRFLQTDPIGTDGGVNLYAYVGNDPVNATDPLGLQCIGGYYLYKGFTDGHVEYLGYNPATFDCDRFYEQRSGGRGTNEGGSGGGGEEKKLSPCVQAFLKQELPKHSLPTSQIPNVRIHSGWAGRAAVGHFLSPLTPAMTIYNNIYTGKNLSAYTDSNALGFWHEIVHTGQYAIGELSVTEYLVTGLLVGGGHDDIMQEMLADKIGQDLLKAWRDGGGNAQCKR